VLKLLTLESLNECFDYAIENQYRYVGVRIAIALTKAEVIINPTENFEEKKAYYNHAYNENLRHKFAEGQDIRITGYAYADSFMEIESKLEFYELTGTSLN
jgi:hypothetical protein